MKKHVELWIEAYLDGELNLKQQRSLEKHLDNCPECLQMIAERQALSNMLQGSTPPLILKSPERFSSEVNLQLSREKTNRPAVQNRKNRDLFLNTSFRQILWYALPLFLLLVFIFVQTVGFASQALRIMPGADVLTARSSTLSDAISTPAFAEIGLGRVPQLLMDITGITNLLGWNTFTQIVILIVIGILYSSWLVGWLIRNNETQFANQNEVNNGGLA